MIISKILITIELIRAGRKLIKDVHSDLKEIKPKGRKSKVVNRRVLVRQKMKEYQGD